MAKIRVKFHEQYELTIAEFTWLRQQLEEMQQTVGAVPFEFKLSDVAEEPDYVDPFDVDAGLDDGDEPDEPARVIDFWGNTRNILAAQAVADLVHRCLRQFQDPGIWSLRYYVTGDFHHAGGGVFVVTDDKVLHRDTWDFAHELYAAMGRHLLN